MSKTSKIILVLVLVVIAVAAVVFVVMNNNKDEKTSSKISISSEKDLIAFAEKIQKGKDLPKTDAVGVDVKDKDAVSMYTGLKDGSNLEYLVVAEPLMNAQAYSLVIAKVKDGKADSVAKDMAENVDMAKWICVSAEKLYATSSGDLAILVMSSEEWAKPVYDAFKKEAGSVGKEYEKDEELPDWSDDFMFPDDLGTPVETDDGDIEYTPTEVVQ